MEDSEIREKGHTPDDINQRADELQKSGYYQDRRDDAQGEAIRERNSKSRESKAERDEDSGNKENSYFLPKDAIKATLLGSNAAFNQASFGSDEAKISVKKAVVIPTTPKKIQAGIRV